nr:basic salivary proline-rich protein 2-like [Odocoileus virginianus texanus]
MGGEQDGQTSLRNVFNGSKFLVSKQEQLMETIEHSERSPRSKVWFHKRAWTLLTKAKSPKSRETRGRGAPGSPAGHSPPQGPGRTCGDPAAENPSLNPLPQDPGRGREPPAEAAGRPQGGNGTGYLQRGGGGRHGAALAGVARGTGGPPRLSLPRPQRRLQLSSERRTPPGPRGIPKLCPPSHRSGPPLPHSASLSTPPRSDSCLRPSTPGVGPCLPQAEVEALVPAAAAAPLQVPRSPSRRRQVPQHGLRAGSAGWRGRWRRWSRERTRAALLRAACATAAPPPPAPSGLLPPRSARPLPPPPPPLSSAKPRRHRSARYGDAGGGGGGGTLRAFPTRSHWPCVHDCSAQPDLRGAQAIHRLRRKNVTGGVKSRGLRAGGRAPAGGAGFWETSLKPGSPPTPRVLRLRAGVSPALPAVRPKLQKTVKTAVGEQDRYPPELHPAGRLKWPQLVSSPLSSRPVAFLKGFGEVSYVTHQA